MNTMDKRFWKGQKRSFGGKGFLLLAVLLLLGPAGCVGNGNGNENPAGGKQALAQEVDTKDALSDITETIGNTAKIEAEQSGSGSANETEAAAEAGSADETEAAAEGGTADETEAVAEGGTADETEAVAEAGTADEAEAETGAGTADEAEAVAEGGSAAMAGQAANAAGRAPQDSYFEVCFIDVGQADAALVRCDGKTMLIDGGNAADSDLIYSFLRNHSLNHLDYIVCTHAHEDHVGGLAGALNYATANTAFCPVTSADGRAFDSFVTYLAKQGVSITVPSAGDRFMLGSASVQVVGPVRPDTDEPNNTSLVLRIVYGETSFLFTGDAEKEEEEDILAAGYELDSDVLKVGHHGGSASTTDLFLQAVSPQYAVISVGKGNSYGHPSNEVLKRLDGAGAQVYRTDLQGDIVCISDGKAVQFSVERNADADTLAPAEAGTANAEETVMTRAAVTEAATEAAATTEVASEAAALTGATATEAATVETVITDSAKTKDAAETALPPAGTDYVLNTNTHKFHYPECSSVKQMKDENKVFYTGTRDEVIAMGYEPCGRCNP